MSRLKTLFRNRLVLIGAVLLVVAIVAFALKSKNDAPTFTTDTVSVGAVKNVVSVSGTLDAADSVALSFPVTGTLASVSVTEGDTVTKGQELASLSHADLSAQYSDAYAALLIAEADRDELISGLRPEELAVTKTTAEIAREDLERVTKEQNDRVENAYRTLLSTDLEARPVDPENDDIAPTVSGTYACDKEGTYTLTMFRSASLSGYSYRLSGLESGTFTAYANAAAPLGSCGLYVQFADGESYGDSTWTIDIPNKTGASYVSDLNAYNLAKTERANEIAAATQKLTLATENASLDTATPRQEARTRADAKVLQAQARLQAVSANIDERVLRAPFSGTVTRVDAVVGETAGAGPIVTMVGDGSFELTALIPEIDVTKIQVGSKADVSFDARPDESFGATVVFVSPLAKQVEGVSYFEAKLALDEELDWLKSGLSADIDIVTGEKDGVLRVPRRYLIGENGSYSLLVPAGKGTRTVPVTVTFIGNDGFAAVEGIEAGTTVVAPE
ncbi:MAG TPA: HlyD family efflux transporter periplasmic adaptor subunit [Candidatus Paceibacterota bacterium]|nr:HlyD family efflux transporter periplasmic adaptor subunit [Candidatus Paceibacterota bacterium]